MRIDHLRYFADAADLQSIKLAAEKNCMSPQGISQIGRASCRERVFCWV